MSKFFLFCRNVFLQKNFLNLKIKIKLYLICLPGNMQVSSVASEGQY